MKKRTFLAIIKVALGVAIAASVVSALRGHTAELKQSLASARLAPLLAGTAAALVYRLVNAGGWSLILRSLGHRVPVVESSRVWLVAETLRWLPGSVWGFCSRVQEARKLGVSAVPASLSLPLELVVTVAAWGTTAVGGLFLSGTAQQWIAAFRWQPAAAGLGTTLAIVAAVVAACRAFPESAFATRLRGFAEQLLRLLRIRPDLRYIASTFVFYTALCVLNGLAFFAILAALAPSGSVSLALCVGVNSAAWLVGFFAIAAPGGIAVREAGAAALLAPQIGFQNALLAAILWRVVQIAVEFACLGLCWVRFPKIGANPANEGVPACPSAGTASP